MADCKIEIVYEDGATKFHCSGSTMDLVTGCLAIVCGMRNALSDAHGGEIAKMLFEAAVKNGIPFEDDDYEKERLNSKEELEERWKKHTAGKEDEQNG